MLYDGVGVKLALNALNKPRSCEVPQRLRVCCCRHLHDGDDPTREIHLLNVDRNLEREPRKIGDEDVRDQLSITTDVFLMHLLCFGNAGEQQIDQV